MAENKNYIPALKYNWLTKVYDPVLQFTMPERRFKTSLIRQMQIRPNDLVLDFGCGSLTLSIMAAQSHPKTEFFGVDIDEKILTIAKEKLSNSGLTIHIKQYDGDKLPYPDNYFDRVSVAAKTLTRYMSASTSPDRLSGRESCGKLYVTATAPSTVGMWMMGSRCCDSSASVIGTSVAPKSTVPSSICRMPPPDPIDW